MALRPAASRRTGESAIVAIAVVVGAQRQRHEHTMQATTRGRTGVMTKMMGMVCLAEGHWGLNVRPIELQHHGCFFRRLVFVALAAGWVRILIDVSSLLDTKESRLQKHPTYERYDGLGSARCRCLEILKVDYPQITQKNRPAISRERSARSSSHVNRLVIACLTYGDVD